MTHRERLELLRDEAAKEALAYERLGFPVRAEVWQTSRDALQWALDEIDKSAKLSAENDYLRVLVGSSNKECVYCGLGADEQSLCAQGFPGCARADDQLLCPEVGAAVERDQLVARVAVLEQHLRRLLAVPRDHMTACDKTMGDSHPCTCGAIDARAAIDTRPSITAIPDGDTNNSLTAVIDI